jgi:hypothetical protein
MDPKDTQFIDAKPYQVLFGRFLSINLEEEVFYDDRTKSLFVSIKIDASVMLTNSMVHSAVCYE